MCNIPKNFTVRPIFSNMLFIGFLIRYILLLHYCIHWSYTHFANEKLACNFKSIQFIAFYNICISATFWCSVSWQIFRAMAPQLSNSCFAILLMSKLLVTSKY